MAWTRNRGRADPAPTREGGCADRIPTARSTASRRRSTSARPGFCRGGDLVSWLAALDELLAERMPDQLEQLGITRRLPDLHGVARAGEIHLEGFLDPAGPRRKQNDAIRQRQGLAEIMGHEQHCLLLAFPDAKQHVVHVDLGVGVERAER